MQKKIITNLILLFGLILNPIFGQNSSDNSNFIKLNSNQDFLFDFVHRVYTTADGLPAMSLTSILQDKKGYIWIGTYDGLVRFDGVEFTIFSRYADSRYDFAGVRSIFEDSDENLWLGHSDEGISCLKKNGEIIKFTSNDGLPNNSVGAICQDKEGKIWFGTNKGLCFLSPEGKLESPDEFSIFQEENIGIINLLCDSKGKIWITSGSANDTFVISENKLQRFTGITKIKNPAVRGICEASDGSLWFGVDPYYAVQIKDGIETVYDVSHKEIDATAVDKISQDSHGRMWFSTDAGLTIMHDNTFTYYDKNSGSPDNGSGKVLEDKEGNYWIPYNRGGLEKLNLGKFRTIPFPAAINSICEDKSREFIWIASDKGIFAYKDNTFVENPLSEVLSSSRVRNVSCTEDGEILVSSYSDRAPQVLMTNDGTIKICNGTNGFSSAKCRISLKAKNGDYYAGTTKGLFILNPSTSEITILNKESGFENEYIMWLFEDTKNQIWAGTNGSGVYLLKDKKIIKHYGTEEGLAGNIIFKICQIDDELWISTSTGLSTYIEKTDSFFNFNSSNGLALDGLFQLIVDKNRTAWMTTNRAIFSASFDEMKEVAAGKKSHVIVKSYKNSDGLVTSGITGVSCGTIDSTAKIYFPLVDGFAIYNPDKSDKNEIAPKIEIQEYTVDSEKFEYHGEKIILPPGTKRFSVKFTGLSFVSSESINFKTMLEGFDSSYSNWSRERQVSYTNLKQGNYRLYISSQNGDGVEAELENPIEIEKKPFLWELWWFWTLVGFGAALLITSIILRKIHTMRVYQEELEQKVEERTQELKITNRNLKSANEKAESLLLNILPKAIADELTEHSDKIIAKKYPNVTVIFTDIVGFTKMSSGMKAETIVKMLNLLVSLFDERAKREGIEKIKTIGDAYMAAIGLSEESDPEAATKMVKYALGLLRDVRAFNKKFGTNIQIRIGINTGNLVAGVIGKSKFIYDLWGDTVNVASRMESSSEPMKIHVSESTYEQTKNIYNFSEPLKISVKGKGEMKTYFLLENKIK